MNTPRLIPMRDMAKGMAKTPAPMTIPTFSGYLRRFLLGSVLVFTRLITLLSQLACPITPTSLRPRDDR